MKIARMALVTWESAHARAPARGWIAPGDILATKESVDCSRSAIPAKAQKIVSVAFAVKKDIAPVTAVKKPPVQRLTTAARRPAHAL